MINPVLALLAAASLIAVPAPPQTASGRWDNYPENKQVVDQMCRRWMPVMHRLMKRHWPESASSYEDATSRFQPRWQPVRPAQYRRVLNAWMYQKATVAGGGHPLSRRAAARLVGRLLATRSIRAWRTRLAVPFLERERRMPRYREVTRISVAPFAGSSARPRAGASYIAGYFYIVSKFKPVVAEVGSHSTDPGYLFLFRGQPYFLVPFTNQVRWIEIADPHETPRYPDLTFGFGCDQGKYDERPSRDTGSGLNLLQDHAIHSGWCQKGAWSMQGSARKPLACNSLQLVYDREKKGQTDTMVVLQLGSDVTLQLAGLWSGRHSLPIRIVQTSKVAVKAQGSCTGDFNRPKTPLPNGKNGLIISYGATITADFGAGQDFAVECNDLRDAQGRPLASFRFVAD